ncbi:11441_t:CDS:2, partial [Racocetra fulgida]
DLSRLDKLEQRVTDSIIDDLLSPHIAVIKNYQDFADKFIVKLHSHLKTSGSNIRNALPITVDLNNIDELDKDGSYHPYGGGYQRGSSLKEVIELIETVSDKPFSLPAVSDDNS